MDNKEPENEKEREREKDGDKRRDSEKQKQKQNKKNTAAEEQNQIFKKNNFFLPQENFESPVDLGSWILVRLFCVCAHARYQISRYILEDCLFV